MSQKLGLKHRCTHCNALFYDLNNPQPICPACQKPHNPEDAIKLKPFRSQEKPTAKPAENINSDDENNEEIPETEEESEENPITENIKTTEDTEET